MIQMASLKIYGAIGDWSGWLDDYVTASQVYDFLAQNKGQDIDVYINSGGGVVDDGIAIYNALKRHTGKVTVYVDALAASAASVIAMAGDVIVMYQSSMMMIHNPHTIAVGESSDMRKTADVLDKRRDQLLAAYKEKTGKGDDELTALLDGETWMSAEEALEIGFADLVVDDKEQQTEAMLASVMLPAGLNVPERIAAMVGTLPERVKNKPTAATVAATTQGVVMDIENTGTVAQAANKGPELETQAIVADALRAERERIQAITNIGVRAGLDRSVIDIVVAAGKSIDASATMMLEELAKSPTSANPIASRHSQTTVQVDAFDNFKAGALNSILSRGGVEKLEKGNVYAGMSLANLARDFAATAGLESRGSDDQVVQRVFAFGGHGTSDFKEVLRDAAHKSLLVGYEEQPEIFEQFCRIGNLSNFLPHHRTNLNSFSDLVDIVELGEFTSGDIKDRGQTIKAKTYGRNLFISRQAIINDDLSAFSDLPRKMGAAARRTVGNEVIKVLTGDPNMDDGTKLFSNGKGNKVATALGEIALIAAKTAMRKQKDGDATLNITPSYLIVPAALETLAIQLMNNTVKLGGTNNEMNPVSGLATVLADARIDAVDPTYWFLAANPGLIDTVEVAYLNGVAQPFIDSSEGWTVDGTKLKVRHDFGVRALDYKGLYWGGA
jgi:ATP-dependent Clp endopeptidase proteolytic subunit ClpP